MIDLPPTPTNDHSRPTLIATRGLPGSGKSTWAREQLATHPAGTIARCNRDDLRRMIHGEPRYDPESETIVNIVQHRIIRALLEAGQHVIVDDTNLSRSHLWTLEQIANQLHADYRVQDFTDVPLETCIARDAHRRGNRRVGERVIRDMHDRHLTGSDTP